PCLSAFPGRPPPRSRPGPEPEPRTRPFPFPAPFRSPPWRGLSRNAGAVLAVFRPADPLDAGPDRRSGRGRAFAVLAIPYEERRWRGLSRNAKAGLGVFTPANPADSHDRTRDQAEEPRRPSPVLVKGRPLTFATCA